MAIDVATAPNATVINLLGQGAIYGDIAVKSGDQINVEEAIDVSSDRSHQPDGRHITGNIELQSDADAINVTKAETNFNGT